MAKKNLAENSRKENSTRESSTIENSTKMRQLIPFTVTAKLPCATITIEGKESEGKVIFMKKLEGQCRETETFDLCVERLAKLIVTYGELLTF